MICPKPCHNSHDLSRILQRSWCFFFSVALRCRGHGTSANWTGFSPEKPCPKNIKKWDISSHHVLFKHFNHVHGRSMEKPIYKCWLHVVSCCDHPQDKIPPGFDQYGWHQTALGRHECYWTTSKKSATRNPEWNEEKEFMLRTGLTQGGKCHCQSAPKNGGQIFRDHWRAYLWGWNQQPAIVSACFWGSVLYSSLFSLSILVR